MEQRVGSEIYNRGFIPIIFFFTLNRLDLFGSHFKPHYTYIVDDHVRYGREGRRVLHREEIR